MSTDRQPTRTTSREADSKRLLSPPGSTEWPAALGASFSRTLLVRGGQRSGYDIDGVVHADGRTQLLAARSGDDDDAR